MRIDPFFRFSAIKLRWSFTQAILKEFRPAPTVQALLTQARTLHQPVTASPASPATFLMDPKEWILLTLYTPTDRPDQPADLFLAGSCVASNHWREALLTQLDSMTLTIFNPERTDFPPESLNDPRYHDQVAWERTALRHSRCIALWFDSAKPTSYASRLELGVAIGRNIPCIVGMEPDFPGSIYLQTYLVDPVYLTYAAFERAVLQAASILEARPPLVSSSHPHDLPSTPFSRD